MAWAYIWASSRCSEERVEAITTTTPEFVALRDIGAWPAEAPLEWPPPQEASPTQARTAQGAASGRGTGIGGLGRQASEPGAGAAARPPGPPGAGCRRRPGGPGPGAGPFAAP